MTTLAELVPASRVFALRTGIVATLAAALPEVEVRALPGLIDIDDFDKGLNFRAPAIGVAVGRLRSPEMRMSGTRDLPVEVILYVVVEDCQVAGRLVYRDELGLALCDGLLGLLMREPARWGLSDIGFPEEPAARPVLSFNTESKSTAYFAVTFVQTLYALGEPFMDMESPVPADAEAHAVLPGDPDFEEEP